MSVPIRSKGDILVVDDTPANLRILITLLTERGYHVRPAPSGPLALKAVQARLPELILLDVMMPDMDGYEVCERLKADEETRAIPVIFLSAIDETLNKVRAFSVGAVDYITKPFQVEEVVARIKTHLALYRLQRQQQEMFHRFATKEVVDELLEHGFSLGGQQVEATALFADIRSFTTITESNPPAEVIALLNEYFDYMVDVVGSEGGIVNQFVGDGLMAIFGAPVPYEDHALRAVQAAIKMIAALEVFNQERAAAGKYPIRIGIGIASGQVVAGYLGNEHRATYTCVGDPVNVAARLEAYTKEVGLPILIDANTQAMLGSAVSTEPRGLVELRGKTQPVQMFSIPITEHEIAPLREATRLRRAARNGSQSI